MSMCVNQTGGEKRIRLVERMLRLKARGEFRLSTNRHDARARYRYCTLLDYAVFRIHGDDEFRRDQPIDRLRACEATPQKQPRAKEKTHRTVSAEFV